jgi:hypothetical protein
VKDYYVIVCPAWEHPEAAIWTFSIRDPLPTIPVPIAKDLPPVNLALGPCAERVYRGAGYGSKLDYRLPLSPRLRKVDADWVAGLLPKRSSRKSS